MKKLNVAMSAISLALLMPAMTSCKSDSSPFDMFVSTSTEKEKSTIQLRLNVEDTRAEELSTEAEKKINRVTIHVFDADKKLEVTKSLELTENDMSVTLEVTHGFKTLYVVSEISNVNPAHGTDINDYENMTFTSTLDKLRTIDATSKEIKGVVMVGKSKEQMVMNVPSQDALPASNIFDIKLTRLVAKAQVKSGNVNGATFGISFGDVAFKAYQLNQRMRVVHNGTDVFDSEASSFVDSSEDGTYDNYTRGVGEYLTGKKTNEDFTASGCAYLSENIVNVPKSGNTTFLSVRYATKPTKYYTFNSTTSKVEESTEEPVGSTTYYAVGIQDKKNGLVDYTIDASNNHIITFNSLTEATAYMNSLNREETSAVTVSQTDTPLMAPSRKTRAGDATKFEVVTFDNGYAYYRVNIAHSGDSGDTYKVMRNKFYKVNINSVSGLGFGSEDLLCPTSAGNDINPEGHSWISASISVADWAEVVQNVDL